MKNVHSSLLGSMCVVQGAKVLRCEVCDMAQSLLVHACIVCSGTVTPGTCMYSV